MEKVMTVEDKIRRAEEIYYKRKNREVPVRECMKQSKRPQKHMKLLNKMIKQIIICLLIYSIFYFFINNNYIFSQDFTNKVKEILSQDINFAEFYPMLQKSINFNSDTDVVIEETEEQESKNVQTTENLEQTKEQIQSNNENIGGAEEIQIPEETILSQMEQDVQYIKNTINFIKPVNGTVSSMFGIRNPTTESVPKNHTGTDIAAIKGTKIISATDGTVIYADSKGDFGKHIKIQINDIVILYAHCNKLYIKEGDVIKQGQEIAEVGTTGNTTGPHLHFEIRYQDRCVDPQLILEL